MTHVLCILATHFNNEEEVLTFARHISRLDVPDNWRVEILIADNSGNWSGAAADTFLSVFRPPENLGYLNGCAFALEQWRERGTRPMPDLILIANTDVAFADRTLHDILAAEWEGDIAAIGPDIRTTDGRRQNPFLRIRPSRARIYALYRAFTGGYVRRSVHLLTKSSLYPVWQRLRRRSTSQQQVSPSPCEAVYAVHGSAMFVTRAFFRSGCTLRLPWLMLGEEIHLAEQTMRAGLSVVWLPGAVVTHRVGSTTGAAADERVIQWRADALAGLWEHYFKTPEATHPTY